MDEFDWLIKKYGLVKKYGASVAEEIEKQYPVYFGSEFKEIPDNEFMENAEFVFQKIKNTAPMASE